jgi:2-succinyl-6-hydroxy-2,4-cyclohexadiene-1-carboxylate synthase
MDRADVGESICTGPNETSWETPDGVNYRVLRWGSGRPLVCLHGFTGDASSWAGIARDLSPRWEVLAIDLLGHGRTAAPSDGGRYRVDRQVEDLAGLVAALTVEPIALIGYSMGARLALAFAVARRQGVSCLVLESGTAGIDAATERAARQAADEALAASIERDGIAAFVDRWEHLPLWASQVGLPDNVLAEQRAIRLRQRPVGLAGSLRGFGQGVAPSLRDNLPSLPMRVLTIAGALDEAYARRAGEMASAAPRGRSVVIAGAGHAPHLEQPAAFLDAISLFLEECGDGT